MAVFFAGLRSNPNPIPAGPFTVKLPLVKGIELPLCIWIEAKSLVLSSPPGSKLLATLSRNLYAMIIFQKYVVENRLKAIPHR